MSTFSNQRLRKTSISWLLLVLVRCLKLSSNNSGRSHFKLIDNIEGFLNIESQGLETWVYVDFTLLRYHVLRDDIKIRKRLVHERRNVISPLQYLRIHVRIYEIQQLVEHFFNIGNLI